MKIRSICVVKDESDVIVECLTAALEWSDQIVVLDNGSTDGTWDIVQELARREPRIIPLAQDLRPFTEGIRVRCFRALAGEARPGDWWARLDADEFFAEDPRRFLEAVPSEAFSVWSTGLTYYFTDADARRYEEDPASFAPGAPVRGRMRYYLNDMSEPRFFRHARILRWREEDEGYPPIMWRRPVYEMRILVQHYRYRSPEQIQRRLDARRSATYYFSHERVADWAEAVAKFRDGGTFPVNSAPVVAASWRDRIMRAADLEYDSGSGEYALLPEHWPALPDPRAMPFRERARLAIPLGTRHKIKKNLGWIRDLGQRATADSPAPSI